MRLPTAVILALTFLLAMSVLGAVAATPSASTSTVSDRSPSDSPLHNPAVLGTQSSNSIDPASSTASMSAQQSPPTAADPAQVIRINVTETGDTVWTIESRFLLADDDDIETFQAYADDVIAGNRDVEIDRQRFEHEAALAEQSTGRSMSIEGVGWNEPRTELPEDPDEFDEETRIGVLSYSFTWTNYAVVDGDRLRFGIHSPLHLSSEQRLVVQSPSNHGFDEFNTPPTTSSGGAFIWDGPREFEDTALDIVFVRVAGPVPPAQNLTPLVGSVAIVAVAISYLVARRRSADKPLVPAVLSRRLPTTGGPQESDRPPQTDDLGPDRHGPPRTDPPVPESDSDGEQLLYDEDEDVDPELLSDEERVHRLLKQNGGRMKQASIVSETGWSNAKVSQLLSKMDDDEEIEKLRIGRENLITLPDVDLTEVD